MLSFVVVFGHDNARLKFSEDNSSFSSIRIHLLCVQAFVLLSLIPKAFQRKVVGGKNVTKSTSDTPQHRRSLVEVWLAFVATIGILLLVLSTS